MSKHMPIGRSLLLAGLVASGLAIVCVVVVAFVSTLVSGFAGQTFERVYVRLDGAPLLYRYASGLSPSQHSYTLDGQPADSEDQQLLFSMPINAETTSVLNPLAAKSWQWRLASASDGRTPATYWYLVHDGRTNGRVFGVGYNAFTKQLVGFFGRQGFSTTLPPRDQWFQVAGQEGLLNATPVVSVNEPVGSPQEQLALLAEGKLWSFNTQTRTVESLLDAPQATTLGQAWVALDKLPPKKPGVMLMPAQYLTRQKLVLRSPDDCLLVDLSSGEKSSFPVPSALRKVAFSAYELASGEMLLVSAEGTLEKRGQRLIWLAKDGTVNREKTVELAQLANSRNSYAMLGWLGVIAAPLPLGHAGFTLLAPVQMLESGAVDSYASGLARMVLETWASSLIVLAIGVVVGILAYRRQRRYGLPRAAAWAAFVFVFGIPGWIAYRFHRAWPVLEECPACHQPSPRDREACLDCGAFYPPPPLKGIEVFA
jgi:hypothetical protein